MTFEHVNDTTRCYPMQESIELNMITEMKHDYFVMSNGKVYNKTDRNDHMLALILKMKYSALNSASATTSVTASASST